MMTLVSMDSIILKRKYQANRTLQEVPFRRRYFARVFKRTYKNFNLINIESMLFIINLIVIKIKLSLT